MLDAGQLADRRTRYGAAGEDAADDPGAGPASASVLQEPVKSGDAVRTHMNSGASPHHRIRAGKTGKDTVERPAIK